MKNSWTNYDRVALAEWLGKDLGQKFLRFLEEGRPEFPDEADINQMAIAGAKAKGYALALKRINSMVQVEAPIESESPYVDVETD